MKDKGRFSFPFLLVLLLLMTVAKEVKADEGPSVEPNQYERNPVELRTDYIREQSLLNGKKELPKEQLTLTFQRSTPSVLERTKAQLFLSSERNTNTITTKAEKLKLFSSAKEITTSSHPASNEEEATNSSHLLWVFGILIFALLAAMFAIVVPRMKQFVR